MVLRCRFYNHDKRAIVTLKVFALSIHLGSYPSANHWAGRACSFAPLPLMTYIMPKPEVASHQYYLP